MIPATGIVGARLIEAAATEVRAVLNLVMRALRDQTGEHFDPEAVYPDRVVIYKDGRYWAYPYSIAEDNAVTIGPGREVVMQHAEVAPRMTEALADDGERAFIEAVGEPAGGVWLIRVIRAGESGNRNYYPDAVLRDAVRLVEGARVLEKSDAEHVAAGDAKSGVAPGKSFRNLVGALRRARFVEGEGEDSGEIQAELHLIQPDGEVALRVREAHARGMSDLFGFSIDASAKARVITKGGRKLRAATQITKVHSVDLIVEPGAGGALLRIVEAATEAPPATNHPSQEDEAMRQRMIEAIKAHNPRFDDANATDEQIEAAFIEARAKPATPAKADIAPTDSAALAQVRVIEARMVARDLVGAAKLPQPAKERLLSRFLEAKAPFEAADVSKAIDDERAYLARFTESGKPVIHFDEMIQVEDRSTKVGEMLDNFFAGKDGVHSFKECYVEITGDRLVTGRIEECDRARLAESTGNRFVEAIDTAAFGNVLGAALRRAMIAEYNAAVDYDMWRPICNVVSVADFRTNERTRFGGYGDMPAVAQGADYVALTSPTDEKASYAATKRGGIETVTLETIKNDDVGAVRQIPSKLGRAAKRTLAKFVLDFLRTNPTIYDTLALFHATHTNLFTAALSATEFAAHRLAMMKQAEAGSSDRLGIGPSYLLVPPDLQETAFNLFARSTNNDKTFVQTLMPTILPVWYWTDANDWCTAANPRDIPGLEIGFLDGREEPELFIQDAPNVGSMFASDKLTYKVRHIYGGTLTNYRGFTKAVVA